MRYPAAAKAAALSLAKAAKAAALPPAKAASLAAQKAVHITETVKHDAVFTGTIRWSSNRATHTHPTYGTRIACDKPPRNTRFVK